MPGLLVNTAFTKSDPISFVAGIFGTNLTRSPLRWAFVVLAYRNHDPNTFEVPLFFFLFLFILHFEWSKTAAHFADICINIWRGGVWNSCREMLSFILI